MQPVLFRSKSGDVSAENDSELSEDFFLFKSVTLYDHSFWIICEILQYDANAFRSSVLEVET